MRAYLLLLLSLIVGSAAVNASDMPPTPRITLDSPARSELIGYTGETLTFSSSTSSANCGTINQRRWRLDSGSYVYATNFTHTFTLPAGVYEKTYTLELRTRNTCNLYKTETKTITIRRDKRVYFVKDHLGSVRATVNEAGDVIGHDDYYPFGLTMPGRSANTANPNDNYKFTGYENDDEGGLDLYHANARGYDPVLGRFMQVDPLAADYPSLSPFAYVANNPLLYIDPSGLSYYYHGSGRYLGESDDDKDDVYVFRETSETMSIEIGGETIEAKVLKSERLENDNGEAISHDTFLNFGALVYGESSGDRNESYGIANAVVNYTNASNGKYSLSDIVSKKNSYSYAVGESLYNSFKSNGLNKQNARSVNGAVINALTGGMDYSNGATHWDGTDLGKKGLSHYRSRIGFSISQDHANLYFLNTGYSLTSVGANPVYRSTAVRGKTIFWRSHPYNTLNTIYHKYQ